MLFVILIFWEIQLGQKEAKLSEERTQQMEEMSYAHMQILLPSARFSAIMKTGCNSTRTIDTNVVILAIATFKTINASDLWLHIWC